MRMCVRIRDDSFLWLRVANQYIYVYIYIYIYIYICKNNVMEGERSIYMYIYMCVHVGIDACEHVCISMRAYTSAV